MNLLIDIGNSRIKWRWREQSGVANSAAELFAQCAQIPASTKLFGCAVGADSLKKDIDAIFLQHWQHTVAWLKVSANALGIHNHYHVLTEQGPDRWAAILGASQHFPRQNLLVISAGTALVIDTLTADGDYLGGTIAPGLGLMKSSLHLATARLPQSSGVQHAFPQSTLDAIETGCLRAMLGSIQLGQDELIARAGRIDGILIFGGDAAQVQALLKGRAIAVDNLVLDGLAALLAAGDGDFSS